MNSHAYATVTFAEVFVFLRCFRGKKCSKPGHFLFLYQKQIWTIASGLGETHSASAPEKQPLWKPLSPFGANFRSSSFHGAEECGNFVAGKLCLFLCLCLNENFTLVLLG